MSIVRRQVPPDRLLHPPSLPRLDRLAELMDEAAAGLHALFVEGQSRRNRRSRGRGRLRRANAAVARRQTANVPNTRVEAQPQSFPRTRPSTNPPTARM